MLLEVWYKLAMLCSLAGFVGASPLEREVVDKIAGSESYQQLDHKAIKQSV